MDPGSLREPVELRQLSETPDAMSAGTLDAYTLIATVRAKFETVGWMLYRDGVQTGDSVTHRAYIRYRADVTTDTYMIRRGNRYRVQRVAEMEDRQFLKIELNEEGPA